MKKGFTLIELLVVVLIIGILSAIALPQYQKAVEKAKTAEAVTNIKSIEEGISLYLLENGFSTENINFFGENANGAGALAIDMAGSLQCSDQNWCYSKNFGYTAWCEGSRPQCHIQVSSADGQQTINLQSGYENGAWERFCVPGASAGKKGKQMCKLMAQQGFSCPACAFF